MIRYFLLFSLLLSTKLCFSQTVDFSANVTSGCAPLTVQFQDETIGIVTSWLWDLGKGAGSTSTIQNPSAIYTEPGLYTIVLTVNGNVSKTKTAFIQVFDKPVIDWSFQTQGVCSPMPVAFTDQSTTATGSLVQWQWLFGDGGSSTEKSPTYIYQNAGTYSVTLSVKNSHGCQATRIKDNLVSVPGVVAHFNPDKSTSCTVPAQILFTNQSTGDGNLTYEWNFGDNTTSTAVSPSHTYQQAGDFEVTLTTRNANQCSGVFKKIIKIANEGGIDFVPNASQACVGSSVSFTEITQKNVLSRQWNFGNGIISSSPNPTVIYTSPGIYIVTLEALLGGNLCASIVTKQVQIIKDAKPDFSRTQRCDQKILFSNQSEETVSVLWKFGDGTTSSDFSPEHQYLATGTYTVELTAFNFLGCPSVIQKEVSVAGNPIALFSPAEKQNCFGPSLSGCAPFTLPLQNISASTLPLQSLWTFSDNTQSTQTNVTKTFTTPGVYDVSLKVTNSAGCVSTTETKIYVSNITPTAQFETDKTSVCVGENIKFKDTSQNSNFTCWSFGDGSVNSNNKEVDYAYPEPGIYSVTLTSKNDGCSAIRVKTNLIEVKEPGTDFTIQKNCADPYKVVFTNTSSGYNSLMWDFGDGTTSTAEQFSHTFPLGQHTIKLTSSSNSTGCSVTKEQTIVIQDIEAAFEVANTNICKGEIATFIDKSKFATQWVWSFSDGSGSTSTNPEQLFAIPGQYGAKLTVTDSDGCVDEVELPTAVQVIDITGNFSYAASSTCSELSVEFTDLSVASPPITQWLWSFGNGNTSIDQHATNTYNQLGNYSITLQLTNALGVCSIIRNNALEFSNPVADFALSTNNFCAGDQIRFFNLSQQAINYVWDLGDGRSVTTFTPVATYSALGSYDISLTVKDSYGCEVTLIKPAFINIKKPVAAFEAFQTSAECPPLISTFINRSSNDVVKWNWNFGDGQQSTFASPLNTYKKPGLYDVTLRVEDASGCADEVTLEDIISVGGPFGTIQYPIESCVLDTLQFVATTTHAQVHRWDFADGLVKEGTTQEKHIYEKAGTYKPVLLVIDDKGCEVAIDEGPQLIVYDKPVLDFTTDPSSPFMGEVVTLSGVSDKPSILTWQWLGHKIEQDAIDFVFEQPEKIQITLAGVDEHGCFNEITKELLIQQNIDFLPNVFTPNEDGKNDRFFIPAVSYGSWIMRIYNRWGTLVYYSGEYKNDWTGNNVSGGVYYYALTNNLRPERYVKGYVHVIR